MCAEDLDLTKETHCLVLTEGPILGGGAFSRVSEVTEETTGNTYALKRMRKSAVVQCPEHVYFEQVWGAGCGVGPGRLSMSMQHALSVAGIYAGASLQCG